MTLVTVAFSGASSGEWQVTRFDTIVGPALAETSHLRVAHDSSARVDGEDALWVLRGVTSNERYVTRAEHDALAGRQEPLGRAASTRVALIPITKSQAWWELAQDERRRIFEESSHHVATGMEYLPEIARRLYHGRDLGEPFDFLTWFEFAPGAAAAFDELVGRLRETEEWTYVEREIDIRIAR